MRWPWERTEHRASATDALVAAIVAAASNQGTGDYRAIAAVETAAGLYAAAFASARVVTDDPRVAERLTPKFLATVARALIRRGEFLAILEATPARGLELLPAGSWDVRGGPDERSWWYRADLQGPSGSTSRTVPSAAALHVRYAVDPSRPWRGLSPLESACATGVLAGIWSNGWARKRARLWGRSYLPRKQTGPIRTIQPPIHSQICGAIFAARRGVLFSSKVCRPPGARVRAARRMATGVNLGSAPIHRRFSKRCERLSVVTC